MTDLTQNANQQTQTTASSSTSEQQSAQTDQALSSAEGDLTSDTASDEGDLTSDAPAEKQAAAKEQADPYAQFRGVPETGEYGDYTMPDGAVADPALKAEFDPIVKELGLSQVGAQKLVDFKAKLDAAQLRLWNDYQQGLVTAAKRDPEIGGSRYSESLNVGRSVVSKFGTPEFKEMLRNAGIANHPEMIRFLAKVGKSTGETPALGEGGGAVSEKKPLYELMYGSANKE